LSFLDDIGTIADKEERLNRVIVRIEKTIPLRFAASQIVSTALHTTNAATE
jgi:hypothetical protein